MTTLPPITGLGTTWRIEVFEEIIPEKAQTIYEDLRLFITNFDRRYSHFDGHSKISLFNAARKLPNPDKEMIAILEYGLQLYHDTHEVFNFLTGEDLEKNDYDAIYSFTPKNESIHTPDPTRALFITPEKIILTVGQVDISGYSKGYLIDLLAERLQSVYGLTYFLINGGGNMYATSNFGEPITINLQHPIVAHTYLEQTTLYNEGFAVSSTHKQNWEHEDSTYTHSVVTNIGKGNDASLAVFVKAPDAKLADAWATTLLLSAPENHTTKLIEKNIKVAIFEAGTDKLHYYHGFQNI